MVKKTHAAAAALSILLVHFASNGAHAQNYHYRSGGARVVQQGNLGMPGPSGTYIGPGTLSKTAQGLPVAGRANPLLPSVNMGANVRTPGDNMYTQPQPYQPGYQQAVQPRPLAVPGLPAGRWGANIGSPGDQMRSDLHPYIPGQNQVQHRRMIYQQQGQAQPQGHVYVPGQNGSLATYGSYESSQENQK